MSSSPTMRPAGAEAGASERRRHPRRNVMDRRLVTVNLDNKDSGLMVDLSEAGIAVQALSRIKQGATTLLNFELPDSDARIEALGTVAWADSTSGRAGIHLEDFAVATARQALKDWLAHLNEAAHKSEPDAPPVQLPSRLGPDSKVAEIAALQREISAQELGGDAALTLIVERTRALTRADGSAIVLGDAKLMTCRGSSGSAPSVGIEMRPESGLSGECVRTGVTVRCEDTELDPRVDHEACRAMGLRSAVIVPLFGRGNISGLLEVFYASPRAFDGRDILTLRRMADLISATLARPGVVPQVAPPAKAAVPSPGAAPPIPPLKPPAPAVSTPAESQAKPVLPSEPAAAETPPQQAVIVCDVCGHQNPSSKIDCEKCNVPLPGRVRQSAHSSASIASSTETRRPRVSYELMEKYPGPQPSAEPGIRLRVTRPRLLILIVILVLVAGVWGWQEFRRRQERPAPELNIAPSTQTRVDPAPQPSGATSEPLRIMAVGAPVNRDAPALLNAGVSIKPSPRPPLTPASEVMVGALPQSAVKIPVAPVAALPSPPRSAENPPDVAPPSLGWVPEQPVVAVLQAPVVAPSLVKRETSVVSEAQILRRVEPRYPQLAVNNHMQGAVVLKAAILRTGEVGHIRLVKGNELLGRAAIEAVRQWRYKPEQLDGRPVEVDTTITIHFSLNR